MSAKHLQINISDAAVEVASDEANGEGELCPFGKFAFLRSRE